MKKLFFILLFVLISMFSNAQASTDYTKEVVKTAKTYDKVRELTNKNDGPEIERWLKNVGLGPRQSWCNAFVYSMYLETKHDKNQILPYKTGRVAYSYLFAKRNPIRYKVISVNQVRLGIETLKSGDIAIWSTSNENIIDFNGHTGLVITQTGIYYFETIEGNTQPSSIGDQREGGGVYYKTRPFLTGPTFKLKGFIRII